MQISADGSAIADDGKVLHFSMDRFISDICEGEACFICGRTQEQTRFNNEHILPNWMLRKYSLHNQTITLPNDQVHRYGTYTLPCCMECNTFLAQQFEAPISELFERGQEAIIEYLETDGPELIFLWMATIFLKIHLKDNDLRHHLDHRDGDNTIAEANEYEWNIFYYLHTLIRANFVGTDVSPRCLGSIWLQRVNDADSHGSFDLVDFSVSNTLMLRLDSLAIIAVFDDANASFHGIRNIIDVLPVEISSIQVRELVAHFACCNLHLINRPYFHIRIINDEIFLGVDTDESPRFEEKDKALFGRLFQRAMSGMPLHIEGASEAELRAAIENGNFSVLLDADYNYLPPRLIARPIDGSAP